MNRPIVRWESIEGTRGGGVCDSCAIEVHVIVDKALFDIHGAATQGFVDDVIAGVDAAWSQSFSEGGMGLNVVLTGTTIFEDADPWPKTTAIFDLIGEATDYVDTNLPTIPDGRDTVLLLTGLDLDGASIGVATVGTLTRSRSVAIAQVSSMSLEAAIANSCHQLGHNAGATHDGAGDNEACGLSEHFMGVISLSSPPTSFSTCSIPEMLGYMLSPQFDVIDGLSYKSPACAADLNGDGALDFFDVSAFLVAYNAMDSVADFNDDGMFNFFDVSAFLVSYNAGCP